MPPRPRLRLRGREVRPLLVFPPEDRAIYNDLSYPWGLVCKTIMKEPWGLPKFKLEGSGCIVGPRHVLTASHVVDWSKHRNGMVEVHRAFLNVRVETPVIAAWTLSKVSNPVGWTEVDEDFTVLITKDRIGDQFGWFGVKTYDSTWDDADIWTNIGYTGAILDGTMPTVQKAVSLNEHDFDYGSARAMSTKADMTPGSSGGPFFRFWNKGPYVVAVASGEDDGENYCAGGPAMTRLVHHSIWIYP